MVTAKHKRIRQPDLTERLAIVVSQRDALLCSLRAVLATIPHEFATAEVQAVRREARAVCEEISGS